MKHKDYTEYEFRNLSGEIIEKYKERLNKYTGSARKYLDIFENQNDDLVGSNCFAPLLLRECLPESLSLATLDDAVVAGLIYPNEFRSNIKEGIYVDLGLVLRTSGDSYLPNDYLSRDLAKQLEERGLTLKTPKALLFDALSLRVDNDSCYGLSYDLNERAELGNNILDLPSLVHQNDGKRFRFKSDVMFLDKDKEIINPRFRFTNDLIVFDNEGENIIKTRKDGLARLSFDRGLYLCSSSHNLDNSNSKNRVYVVSPAEGDLQEMPDLENNSANVNYQLSKPETSESSSYQPSKPKKGKIITLDDFVASSDSMGELEKLTFLLDSAIKAEDYERAAELRDKITKLKTTH